MSDGSSGSQLSQVVLDSTRRKANTFGEHTLSEIRLGLEYGQNPFLASFLGSFLGSGTAAEESATRYAAENGNLNHRPPHQRVAAQRLVFLYELRLYAVDEDKEESHGVAWSPL